VVRLTTITLWHSSTYGVAAAPSGSPAQGEQGGPPIISINGENPATIQVGVSYADLGAQITGPQQHLNLGMTTLLDGATTTDLTLDTGVPGTHTIEYRAFDQSGLMGSASRTVIVSATNDDSASTTPPAANENPPPLGATGTNGATTTDASSTAQ
jgi:surface protein with Ig-like domain